MRPWQVRLLTVATGLALASPATAGDSVSGAALLASDDVVGKCTYAGFTHPSGGAEYVFGGTATGTAAGGSPPALVAMTCTLVSPAQGIPGEQPELRASTTCHPGPVCSVPPGTAGPWPLRPVLICVSGSVAFGPADPVVEEIPATCTAAPL